MQAATTGLTEGDFTLLRVLSNAAIMTNILDLIAAGGGGGGGGIVTGAQLPLSVNQGVLSIDTSSFCTSACAQSASLWNGCASCSLLACAPIGSDRLQFRASQPCLVASSCKGVCPLLAACNRRIGNKKRKPVLLSSEHDGGQFDAAEEAQEGDTEDEDAEQPDLLEIQPNLKSTADLLAKYKTRRRSPRM